MKSCAICGSHAFNMATEGVNQGGFCDRHYWQRKAEALEAARATPALPQAEHDLEDVRCQCCGYMTYHSEHMGCIRSAYKQALPQVPEGMAIVPVEQVEKILPRIDAELQVIDAIIQCTQAMLPQETLDEIETSLALLQDIRAMLAAAKEKGE